ncbi:hypothetical protein M0R45_018163 [Rubus argutus]|uniref:Uncharacterized protein n=1 Tax=Rubus argutus TaxID=59490 RepID=A0AAW1X5F1_RUBAR
MKRMVAEDWATNGGVVGDNLSSAAALLLGSKEIELGSLLSRTNPQATLMMLGRSGLPALVMMRRDAQTNWACVDPSGRLVESNCSGGAASDGSKLSDDCGWALSVQRGGMELT